MRESKAKEIAGLSFHSEKHPEERRISYTYPVPEEIYNKIVADLKTTYGENIDFEIQRIHINVWKND